MSIQQQRSLIENGQKEYPTIIEETQQQSVHPLMTKKRTRATLLSTSCRDTLTEDEKRMNHIASEQKRRNTIRSGFKELTEIVPTLKNINNSKSTILFKAVDYIKYLDKRNRNLNEKITLLQIR
ncbi:Myc-type, basic helix-loop-helix domain-containing protein, partial [Cokeromyces recurvatus]|uniref:Myc-type, basic helix-loop-helix domain-containing protein n=1 Tax=Cokeromyces recurvatus TaxID=90255 RepID=UPI0022208F3C